MPGPREIGGLGAWIGPIALLAVACVAVSGLACAPAGEPRPLGTYAPDPTWASRGVRSSGAARGLARREGDVVVLEGAGLVSGTPGDWGLTVEDPDSDVARVVAAAAAAGADVPGVLVVFTSFEDRGAGGAGYYLPIFNDTPGTGMGAIDVRAAYGAARLEGVVNLKHPDQALSVPFADLGAHELAHRHAAHLAVVPSSTTTTIPSILGRQDAHWHAALEADASFLDGYAWADLGGGRFRVEARLARLGSLDLYALGLIEAREVPPFFFIAGAATEGGAAIPPAAQLGVGTVVRGARIDLTVEDVIAAVGVRPSAPRELRAAIVLVTAPDQSADDPTVVAVRARVDARRRELEAAWASATGGRGALCTALDGCASAAVDAGEADAAEADAATEPARDAAAVDAAREVEPESGCGCRTSGGAPSVAPLLALTLLAAATRARR